MHAGRIAFHGVDAAVGGASAAGHHGQRLGSEAVNPLIGGDGLAGLGIGAERRPVSLLLDLLVGDGAFHHEHERIQLPFSAMIPVLEEIISHFVRQHGIVQVYFGQPGNSSQQNIFNAGLSCCGDGNESPSQPRPAVIQRMCTSETAGAFCVARPCGTVSAAIADSPFQSLAGRELPNPWLTIRKSLPLCPGCTSVRPQLNRKAVRIATNCA